MESSEGLAATEWLDGSLRPLTMKPFAILGVDITISLPAPPRKQTNTDPVWDWFFLVLSNSKQSA